LSPLKSQGLLWYIGRALSHRAHRALSSTSSTSSRCPTERSLSSSPEAQHVVQGNAIPDVCRQGMAAVIYLLIACI
jgi:hypothetical protein